MPMKKTAISLPPEVLADVDSAAEERGETRSGFIAKVLGRVACVRQDWRITREIDRLFADEQIVKEQRDTARASVRAQGDKEGARWDLSRRCPLG